MQAQLNTCHFVIVRNGNNCGPQASVAIRRDKIQKVSWEPNSTPMGVFRILSAFFAEDESVPIDLRFPNQMTVENMGLLDRAPLNRSHVCKYLRWNFEIIPQSQIHLAAFFTAFSSAVFFLAVIYLTAKTSQIEMTRPSQTPATTQR
jgi:hypothetical protein